MTIFRPCIDLHEGKVKQIVGGSLENQSQHLVINFISEKPASYYATLYQQDKLQGGHVVLLGTGNEEAAKSALQSYPQGLQVGGGIGADNALQWLEAGASRVIVTSWIFQGASLSMSRLQQLVDTVGKERLVLDLSCRRTTQGWSIATNRWQTITSVQITPKTLDLLADHCDEFLIHAADVEGKQSGMDEELIVYLAKHSPIPVTYAGGARHIQDLERCATLSNGIVDLTIGSALDIFGGKGCTYAECVEYNKTHG